MVTIVRKYKDWPEKNELVVGKVTNINPNSFFVHLIEYGKDGMVHVSEVASGWVKDINQHVSEGDTVVCKVKGVEKDKNHIHLSLKRTSEYEKKHALDSWKRERRAEKMLERAAKRKGVSLDEAYEDIGFTLQEEFGEMFEGFKEARDNPDLLKKRGISDEWITIVSDIAENTIEEKEIEVKGILKLRCPDSNGVEVIKEELGKSDMEVSYISAPKYSVKIKSKDPKSAEQKLKRESDEVIQVMKEHGGGGSFEVVRE